MSLSLDSVRRFDPENLSIPIGSPDDVRLIQKLYEQTNLLALRAFVGVSVGEIDMTNDGIVWPRARRIIFLSKEPI